MISRGFKISLLAFSFILILFAGFLYLATDLPAIYAAIAAGVSSLILVLQCVMPFLPASIYQKFDGCISSPSTFYFMRGLTWVYFLLLLPFLALAIYAVGFLLASWLR